MATVEVAREAGACYGVERALEMTEDALKDGTRGTTFGRGRCISCARYFPPGVHGCSYFFVGGAGFFGSTFLASSCFASPFLSAGFFSLAFASRVFSSPDFATVAFVAAGFSFVGFSFPASAPCTGQLP